MKKFLLLPLFLISCSIAESQNLGIGVNPPTQKLDVLGNLKFSGALMPNDLPGNADEVLISQGAGVAPIWADGTAGQFWNTVYTTDSVSSTWINYNGTGASDYALVPGLTQTVTVPSTGTFDAFIYTDGGAEYTSNTVGNNNGIQTDLSIWFDGAAQRYETLIADNSANFGSGIRYWSFCWVKQNITAGSHTFEVKERIRSDPAVPQKTATFGDVNTPGKNRVGSLSIVLIRK